MWSYPQGSKIKLIFNQFDKKKMKKIKPFNFAAVMNDRAVSLMWLLGNSTVNLIDLEYSTQYVVCSIV